MLLVSVGNVIHNYYSFIKYYIGADIYIYIWYNQK